MAKQKNGNGRSSHEKPRVALILQGGGALGAYHIGAYQALEEAGYAPDWVTGISIGAFNSSIIVGNQPEDRLDKLEQLWTDISRPDDWGAALSGPFLKMFNQTSAAEAFIFGQPHFWVPRFPNPLLLPEAPTDALSFYDTKPMLATLQRLVDFDLINNGPVRLSLGATQVTTGDLVFFDNTQHPIGAHHVLASGSLPPGFPATRVDGELYWDGGVVSNTPLDAIYEDAHAGHTLVFMIDLWNAVGAPPTNMDQINWRQKQIQYASRTSHAIRTLAAHHNLRRTLKHVSGKLLDGTVDIAPVSDAVALESEKTLDIVHIIYRPSSDQISESDAEFSRPSIAKRREAGYADMRLALDEAPWTKHRKAPHVGTVVHSVNRGKVDSKVFQ
jgi:NTE family protein